MKKFISEYGFGILVAIAVIMLICLTTPVGQKIGDSVKGIVNGFSSTTNTVMNTVDPETTIELMNLKVGDVITIEGHKYRILALEGTEAELMLLD